MGYWEENLISASLGYVEFPISDRSWSTGRNFARYSFPYRDGQGVEDLGRKIYQFTLTLPLYRGVGAELYPDTYLRLISLVEDEDQRGELEYVDPEFGPLQVKIVDYSCSTPPGKRDGVTMTLQLEELGFEQSLLSNLTTPNLTGTARAEQLALDVDNEVAIIDDDDKPDVTLTDTWRGFQDALDQGALAADEVAAQLDEVYLVAEKFATFSARDELERWSLFNSIVDFLGAAEDHANDSAKQSTGEELVEIILPDTMSSFDIAQRYLGDANRADEVSFQNPAANHMAYPRGSRVRLSRMATPQSQQSNRRAALGRAS